MNGYGRGEDHGSKSAGNVVTRETFGMTLLLFSVLLLVFSILGSYILGEIGVAITAFCLGTLGFFLYPFLILCIYTSLVMITGKNFISGKWILRFVLLAVSAFLIAHLATSSRYFGNGFGAYMSGCWNAAETSVRGSTAGGVLFGLLAYPARALLTSVGAYVAFSALACAALVFFLAGTPLGALFSRRPEPRKMSTAVHERELDFDDLPPRMKKAEKNEKPVETEEKAAKSDPSFAAPVPEQNPPVRKRVPPPLPSYMEDPPYGASAPERKGYFREERPIPPEPRNVETYGVREGNPDGTNEHTADWYRNLLKPDSSRLSRDELNDRYGLNPKKQAPNRTWDSRAILFSPDPAGDYYRNLAYNGDYSRQRKSSVRPVDPPEESRDPNLRDPNLREYPSPVRREFPTYSEGYRRGAEQPQPVKTRNIIEQKPRTQNEGYALRAEDLNYSRIPSYTSEEFSREFSPADEESLSRRPSEIQPPKPDRFDDRRDRFEEPKDRFDDRRDRFEEPKDRFDDRRDRFEEPKDRFDDRRDRFEEPKDRFDDRRDRFEEPKDRFDDRRDRFDDRRDRFEEPKDRFDDRRDRFEEPKDRFDDRRDRFEEPKDHFDDRRDRFEPKPIEEELSDDTAEEISSLPNLFKDSEEAKAPIDRREVDRALGRMGFGEDPGESRAMGAIRSNSDLFDSDDEFYSEPAAPVPEKPAKKKHVFRPYHRPSLSLLRQYDDRISVPQEEIDRNSSIIIDTLAGFRVDAEIMNVTCGPSVTRYDIDIPRNISLNTVTKRSGEIAMRLHARDGVNMYANNEAGTISIEVPNSVRATVGLASVMQSEEYLQDKPGALMFAIGKDIEGRNVCGNIPKMTHILVAGTTNAGKSVALNAMLVSLVCKYSPEELRLILVDPKRTEFIVYDGLPHLMINEIIGDAQKAIMALNWSIKEMERRYALFEQKTRSGIAVRNVDEYNQNLTEDEERLPKIVFVVDELADLMSVAKKDIEERIQRLTQKARAAGIHLVLATQRPSVDVITGVIKGNLPTRMAVRVIQEVDSRTILDESGAEKLLGMGDMLFKTGGMFNCLRVQGAFIATDELQAIVEDIKANNESYFDPEVSEYINKTEPEEEQDDEGYSEERDGASGDDDPLFIKSLAIVVKLGSASISLIQRKCGVGYNHAGKIMEWMEEKGFVSPFDGKAKARTVLLTKEEFESRYGPLD